MATNGKDPAFLWYPKQWLGDDKVLLMDWDSRGMHHWLLNLSFQQEPPATIPNDEERIRRWLGNPPDDIWNRCWPQVSSAWKLNESINRLEQKGLQRCLDIRQKRKEAGGEGGKQKASKRGSKTLANATRFDTQNALANVENENTNNSSVPYREPLLVPNDSDLIVDEIGHLYPGNEHLEGKPLPYDMEEAIASACAEDGAELVKVGTMNYRDAVERWPASERRFITNPVKFYREYHYKKDPSDWERVDIAEVKRGLAAAIGANDPKYTEAIRFWDEVAQAIGSKATVKDFRNGVLYVYVKDKAEADEIIKKYQESSLDIPKWLEKIEFVKG